MAELFGAAARLAIAKFGGDISEDERNPTVGTDVQELLGGDPERVQVVVVNLSANTVFIGWRSNVSATNGIRLGANGGSASFNADDDATLPSRQLFGVASAIGSQIYMLTLRRESQIAGEGS